MKHRITVLVALLTVILACTACGGAKEKTSLQPADHTGLTEDEQVSLEMDYPDYTGKEERIYAILSNDAEQEISFGIPWVEVFKDETWYRIPEKSGVEHTMELPFLVPGSRSAVNIALKDQAYGFPVGKYRFVLPYTFGDYTVDSGWSHVAMAEFTIVKKAKRTDYQPFVGQIYEPDKALKGGVAAFSGDRVYGEEIIETFFYKALSGVPCEMRIVYPELDLCEHYIYTRGCYMIQSYENRATTTRCYSYLYMDPVTEDLVFSNYPDPDQAKAEGFVVNEPEDVFALGPVSAETQEDVNKAHQWNLQNNTVMKVFLFNPDRDVILIKMDETFGIGYNNKGSGQLFEIEEKPISIRAVSETAAVVQFEKADGSIESRIFDLEKGGFE